MHLQGRTDNDIKSARAAATQEEIKTQGAASSGQPLGSVQEDQPKMLRKVVTHDHEQQRLPGLEVKDQSQLLSQHPFLA